MFQLFSRILVVPLSSRWYGLRHGEASDLEGARRVPQITSPKPSPLSRHRRCPTLLGIVQHNSFHFISTRRTGRVHVVGQRGLVQIGFRTVKLSTPTYGDLDKFVFASISGFTAYIWFRFLVLRYARRHFSSYLIDNDRATFGVLCHIKCFWRAVVRWPCFKCCSKLQNFH